MKKIMLMLAKCWVRVKALNREVYRVARETIYGFGKHECATRAAGLAYRGLLSIFPLMLFLMYLGSKFLTSETTSEVLYSNLEQMLPAAVGLVSQTVDQTLDARGPIGLISGIGLIWSASSLFNALFASLDIIFLEKARSGWRRGLLAATSVIGLGLLFVVSIVLSALSAIHLPEGSTLAYRWLNRGLGILVTILICMLLFRWLPSRNVDKRAALAGSALTGVLWEIAKVAFAWYIASGFTNLGLVYGSLASIVGLMLWAFLTGEIIFIGAEFGAALERIYWSKDKSRLSLDDS